MPVCCQCSANGDAGLEASHQYSGDHMFCLQAKRLESLLPALVKLILRVKSRKYTVI